LKNILKGFLGRVPTKDDRLAEGYPRYLEKASSLGKDLNDFLDEDMGWIKPLPVLEETLFPVFDKFSSPEILELGPGTGRWTRHILKKAKQYNLKRITLVDHSEWMINFLKEYFKDESVIEFVKNNGQSLSFDPGSFDIVFSQGVFIELKPSFIYLYSIELSKVIRQGGYFVFDYFNFDSDEGWNYFIEESHKGNIYYTFYSDNFIQKIFTMAGFELQKKYVYGKAVFAVFRKIVKGI